MDSVSLSYAARTFKALAGVYIITNTVNGKYYVGSTHHTGRRFRHHVSLLRAGKHSNAYLQRAYSLYGESAFIADMLETCPPDQLLAREQYWLDALDCVNKGYNLSPDAGGARGMVRSPEVRTVLSQRARECWERRGVTVSQRELKRQRGEAQRAERAAREAAYRPPTPEERFAQRSAQTQAWFADPEHRAEAAERQRRQWADPEYRARQLVAKKAGEADPAVRQRISRGLRARIARLKAEHQPPLPLDDIGIDSL